MAKMTATPLEELPPFVATDFLAFERHKWSDPDANGERLRVKRKLHRIGESLRHAVKQAGEDLVLRTSIHNPYVYNGNRVDSLWLYLSPSDKAKKTLRDLLGVEFASDTDASYVHVNLRLAIDFDGIELGLRVHERAWWDTQNAKGKASTREGAEEFARVLNEVKGGYALMLHDWKKRYPCGSLKWDDLFEFFRYFEAGRHRIHVTRSIAKDDPVLRDPSFLATVAAEFQSMVPLYRFLLWSPENNHLGMRSK